LATVFEAGVLTFGLDGGGLAVSVSAFKGGDDEAFVDFWRIVVFLGDSGDGVSIGSVTTFFGLPLFLTTSDDMTAVLRLCVWYSVCMVVSRSSNSPVVPMTRVGKFNFGDAGVTRFFALDHQRALQPRMRVDKELG